MSSPMSLLHPDFIRDISPEVLGEDGRMLVLPQSYWETTTQEERALFGNRYGVYSFPTTELVQYLSEFIGDRKAIEIGAGNGVLADALGIPGTDNRQQEMREYREFYEGIGQPIVPYGPNIENLDAREAIRKHRPQVVVGCWVTHKYSAKRHYAGGNEIGVNEEQVIEKTEAYVMIGNERVHKPKSIWKLPHRIEYPDWLYSRQNNGSRNFIAIWGA